MVEIDRARDRSPGSARRFSLRDARADLEAVQLTKYSGRDGAERLTADWRRELRSAVEEIRRANQAILTGDLQRFPWADGARWASDRPEGRPLIELGGGFKAASDAALHAAVRKVFGPLPKQRVFSELGVVVHQMPGLQPRTAELFSTKPELPVLNLTSPRYPIADLAFGAMLQAHGKMVAYSFNGELADRGRDNRVTASTVHLAGGIFHACLATAAGDIAEFALHRNLPRQRLIVNADATYTDGDGQVTLAAELRHATPGARQRLVLDFIYAAFNDWPTEIAFISGFNDQTGAISAHYKYKGRLPLEIQLCGSRATVERP